MLAQWGGVIPSQAQGRKIVFLVFLLFYFFKENKNTQFFSFFYNKSNIPTV